MGIDSASTLWRRRLLIPLLVTVSLSVAITQCVLSSRSIPKSITVWPITHDPDPKLFHVLQNGRYGFIDETGSLRIPAAFQMSSSYFSEGLAAASTDGRWGFIDSRGNFLITPQYSSAANFREGLAAVQTTDGYWGYIDHTGTFVIQPTFASADPFTNGAARIGERTLQGRLKSAVSDMGPQLRHRWINIRGERVDVELVGSAVMPTIVPGGQSFEYIGTLNDGLAVASSGGRWGYIDGSGAVVVPLIYDWTYDFVGGLGKVARAGGIGYVNNRGHLVWPVQQ